MCKGTKNAQRDQNEDRKGHMAVWPHMVLLLIFTTIAMCLLIRLSIPYVALYGLKLYFLALIDPNSFGLITEK